MDEENPHPVFWDDMPGGEEEKVEEAEDDYAPLQPEMIAASYEAAKPRFIEDNDNASVPPEQIASPFEGHGDEEDETDKAEDDYFPLPPEMIAASYEAAKPRFIEDDDDASVPPKQIASPFVGHGDEEEKVEETEDDCAPRPPEMIAASYEAVKPQLIEDNDDVFSAPFEGHGDEEDKVEEAEDEDCAPLPPKMIAASFEAAKPKLIEDNDDASVPLKQIVKDTTLLMFIVIAFLFHMSNKAVPPLVTKTLAIGDVRTSILMSCLCIIAVQIFTVGPLWVTYSNSGVVMVMAIAYTMIFALYPSTNSLVKNLRPVKYNKMKMLKQSSTLISIIALSEVLVCVRSQVQQVSLQSVF